MKSMDLKSQQLSNMFDGWKNLITGNSKALKLAKKRVSNCLTCTDEDGKDNMIHGPYLKFIADKPLKEVQGFKCKECGCPLAAKLRSVNEKCPLNKW